MTSSHREPDPVTNSHALEATVRTDAEAEYRGAKTEYRGQVASTQHRVVTIEFAREGGPHFPIAEELTVSFRSREVFEPFAARSRVIFREDGPFRSRYKFRFNEKDAQTLNALFKRRAAVRMRADEDLPVEVRAAGMKIAPYLECLLRDISKSGMSLRVATEVEAKLCSLDRLQVRFRLPGDDELFDLQADVRYRQLVDDGVHYGLEFDGPKRAQSIEAVERIEAYIQRRKSEIIERALGPNWVPPIE